MVSIKKVGIILKATEHEFENQAVLNPAIIQEGNSVHMFYRAVRDGNYSSIGYCRLEGPTKVVERSNKPVIVPEFAYEKHGCEDPRIVKIGDTYHMNYVAYDGHNALIARAESKDLKKWSKKGVISPKIRYNDVRKIFVKSKLKERYFFFRSFYQEVKGDDVLLWEKDAFLFPSKFNGKYALVHRILPDIQVIYFNDFKELTLKYWKKYLKKLPDYIILEPKYWYESRNIGGGCPPIETKYGWLLIYHSIQNTESSNFYRASAALLDRNDPCKVIARLENPLFGPDNDWEIEGDVNNVVFPTGTAQFDNKLYIYYGAADSRIAVASVNLQHLLDEMVCKDKCKNMVNEIGVIAGEVFRHCKGSPKTVSEISNILDKSERTILLAIGWLNRENKVEYLDTKDSLKIITHD